MPKSFDEREFLARCIISLHAMIAARGTVTDENLIAIPSVAVMHNWDILRLRKLYSRLVNVDFVDRLKL